MNIIKQYSGLKREIYVLFFGRIVTCLGSMVNPLLTLILSNKLHFDASTIASLLLVMSIIQIPTLYISGYLADHYNKRNIIIVCDLVTVVSYFLAGFFDLSLLTIVFIFTASLFATIEYPVYDAIIADLSSFDDRERAYSLNYLGVNLGIILAPSIGGMLFAHHLNLVFYIDAISTGLSTLLIYLFIKDVTVVESNHGLYEKKETNKNVFDILKDKKIIFYFILCSMFIQVTYSQFGFLLPLNLEHIYSEQGAIIYGTLTSLNGLVVILLTPILTNISTHVRDVQKIFLGILAMTIAISMHVFVQGLLPWYYISMILFTIGEIYNTLGAQPYLTRRIPSSHRGRIASVKRIAINVCVAMIQFVIGLLIDHYTMTYVWMIAVGIGLLTIVLVIALEHYDKKAFPLLYKV